MRQFFVSKIFFVKVSLKIHRSVEIPSNLNGLFLKAEENEMTAAGGNLAEHFADNIAGLAVEARFHLAFNGFFQFGRREIVTFSKRGDYPVFVIVP